MSCTSPILAVNYGYKLNDKGIYVQDIKMIKLKPEDNIQSLQVKYGSNFLTLPCGKCLECRKAKAQEWSIRCYLESLEHKDNCFITLTYEDNKRPGQLVKKHFQDFIKKMRNHGIKFRYFLCGEYGSRSHREHGHMLCFGYLPEDLKYHSKTENGSIIYTSDILSKMWSYGFVSVGMLEPASVCYTTRYTMKKITDHYIGQQDFQKEFILMSKRPGLGRSYVDRNIDKLIEDECFYLGEFGIKNFPRYVRSILNDDDPWRMAALDDKRASLGDSILKHNRYRSGLRHEELLIEKNKNNEEIEKRKKYLI